MHSRTCTSKHQSSRRAIVGRAVWTAVAMAVTADTGRTAMAQEAFLATPADGVDHDANRDALVGTSWLSAHLDDPSLVVVALMSTDAFAEGHIPESRQIDWPALEVVDTSGASLASWRESLEATIGDLGISGDSTVVVYDDGSLFAARLWWVLRYLGHSDVRVLDGGLPAWRQAGNAVEAEPGRTASAETTSFQAEPQPELLAQMDEVIARLDDPDVVIVDARTPDEYAKAHIPGAVNVNYPLNAAPEPPRRWKPTAELRALYEAVGATPDKRIIPYCSSGVRSAVTAFTLHLIGYPDVSLYTGSWQEWGPNPEAPKTEGESP